MYGFHDDVGDDWLDPEFDDGYLEEGDFEGDEANMEEAERELETSCSKLMLATKHGEVAEVKHLLASGADASEDRGGITPVVLAVTDAHEEILELLLAAGARPDGGAEGSRDVPNPLCLSISSGHWNMAKMLIEAGADVTKVYLRSGMTALAIASARAEEASSLDIVKMLVNKGVDVTKPCNTETKITALHLWAKYGDTAGTEYLLSLSAPVNAIDVNKYTPLMNAVEGDSIGNVKLLLANGAHVNALNNKGCNAVMLAKSLPVVQELLRAGGKVDVRDCLGRNCLHHAAANNANCDVILALEKAGADPAQYSYFCGYPSDVAERAGFKACAALLKRLYRYKYRRVDPQGAQQKRASDQLAIRAKGMEMYKKKNGVEEAKENMVVETPAPSV